MRIKNIRFGHGISSSASLLLIDNIPFNFIIEDEPRTIKVSGETRIPAGIYKLGIRKELTPLTAKCRELPAYKGWFEWFIEVLNVKNFTGVYFHIGNKEADTEGCQLNNLSVTIDNGEFVGSQSGIATKLFYDKVYPELKAGREVIYEVIDEDL